MNVTGKDKTRIAVGYTSYQLRDAIKVDAKRQGISRMEWCRRAFRHMLEERWICTPGPPSAWADGTEIKRLEARIAELEAERKLFLTSAEDMIEKAEALLASLKKKNGCGKIQEFVDKSVKRFAAMQK
jgi:hypothetical protein